MPSTLIRDSRYNSESQMLSVWFVSSGRREDYENVPPETYGAFRAAFSKGRFFNRHIWSSFAFHPVSEAEGVETPAKLTAAGNKLPQ